MCVIVGRVDTPLITRVRMASVSDSIGVRVLHVRVDVLHVNLQSKCALAFGESSDSHLLEQLQVLFNAGVSPRTVNSLLSSFLDLLSFLEADVGLVLLDELDSELIKFIEVVGRGGSLPRFVAEPLDDVLDVVNELVVLLARVGVVKS